MERAYTVGTGSNAISIKVHTGTTIKCYTVVYLDYVGGQRVQIAESEDDDDNGRIGTTKLGIAHDLTGCVVTVQTIADTSALDAQIIKEIRDTPSFMKTSLLVEYTLSGGKTGTQLYDYDYDDTIATKDGKNIWITKKFDILS